MDELQEITERLKVVVRRAEGGLDVRRLISQTLLNSSPDATGGDLVKVWNQLVGTDAADVLGNSFSALNVLCERPAPKLFSRVGRFGDVTDKRARFELAVKLLDGCVTELEKMIGVPAMTEVAGTLDTNPNRKRKPKTYSEEVDRRIEGINEAFKENQTNSACREKARELLQANNWLEVYRVLGYGSKRSIEGSKWWKTDRRKGRAELMKDTVSPTAFNVAKKVPKR
ncbi:MAG: hypothetical protein ACK526_13955 [Planctomyces sp.]